MSDMLQGPLLIVIALGTLAATVWIIGSLRRAARDHDTTNSGPLRREPTLWRS